MLSKSRLKYIQTLGQKKFRQQEGCFLAEGPKIVEELLSERKDSVIEVLALPEWIAALHDDVSTVSMTEISETELEKISQLHTPNQVIALVRQFDLKPVQTKDRLVLLLDQIQDPGNLGTIIRIADWFGIRDIVCSEDTAEWYNPKVVQSTMGSIARVNHLYTDLAAWLANQDEEKIYAAVLGGTPLQEVGKPVDAILLIGNESKGIRDELLVYAGNKVTIPKKGKAESLNAAVATGILLSHLT